jgi:hypothetical protein
MVKKLVLFAYLFNLPSYAHEYKITYVTMAINLGRKDHVWAFAQEGKKYSFKNDYLSNVIAILKLRWPIIIYIQKKYIPYIQPYLHQHAQVHPYELEDIARSLHFSSIQKIMLKKRLVGITSQGFFASIYYRPLVIKKMDMLLETVLKNPFSTPYFVWIDANRWAQEYKIEQHSALVPELEHNEFIMHYTGLAPDQDVWGMPRTAHDRYCGASCTKVINARILGGSGEAITKMYALYNYFLQKTLSRMHLGTEENLLTYCLYARPDYCNAKEYLYFHRILGYQGN